MSLKWNGLRVIYELYAGSMDFNCTLRAQVVEALFWFLVMPP